MSITTKIETVTPDDAVKWLDLRNSKQRSYRKNYARTLADQILRKNWRVNGESIKFSDEGHLLDGQHRLHAIYLAKQPIQTMVIRGLPEEVFDSLDMGKKRTVADILTMNGEAHGTDLAAAINLVCGMGPVIRREAPAIKMVTFHVSAIDAEAFLQHYPKIRVSAEVASRYYSKMIRPSTVAGLHYIFGQTELATEFAKGMLDGFSPTGRSSQALHIFREAMIANRLSHAKMRRHAVCAMAIKAYNSAYAGEKLKELGYNRDEVFPVPTGFKHVHMP
jgi:hypothetical protein